MFGAARLPTFYMGGGGAGSTPAGSSFDITTATTGFTGTGRVGDQDGTPSDLYFNNDGTKMYVLGTAADRVHEYTLSTAYNVFTASYSGNFVSVSVQETTPNSLAFSSDGTNMYVLGQAQDRVYQYTLSTAWAISSATYASKTFSVQVQETVPTGIDFSADGTKMYIVGSVNDTVHQYTLSTAWDVTTASLINSFSVGTQTNSPQSVRFADSGTKMYLIDQTSVVYQYTLSTAYNLSTASYASLSFALSTVGGYETNSTGFYIKPDGTRFFMVGTTYDYVWSLNIGTAYNISTSSFSTTDNYRLGTNDSTPVGIKFSNNGNKFFFLGSGNDRVYEYSCSTAWDINTATYTSGRFISVGSQEANGQDLAFGDSGTKMYIIGTTSDTIYQYTLSTGFLITTATYASKSFSVTAQESFPTGLVFNNDGTKFYVVGEGASRIFQYSCSTAWDISTASYDSISLLVSGQVTTPAAVAWANAGAKFYVLGQGNDLIAQYTLSTPFDISTASFDTGKTLSILNVDHQAFGMTIGSNGTKLYVVGQNIDRMIQYTLT